VRSAALVLIDMQRYFLDVPGGDAPMPVAVPAR
jgi:isochorismate hydrolase